MRPAPISTSRSPSWLAADAGDGDEAADEVAKARQIADEIGLVLTYPET